MLLVCADEHTKRAIEAANADDAARDRRAWHKLFRANAAAISTNKPPAPTSIWPLSGLPILGDFLGQQFQQHLMPIFIAIWVLLALGDQFPVERNIRIMYERRHCSLR
jgi:hypothetical protein